MPFIECLTWGYIILNALSNMKAVWQSLSHNDVNQNVIYHANINREQNRDHMIERMYGAVNSLDKLHSRTE